MEALTTIADSIKAAAASADEAGRKDILDSLRDLQYSIERPEDTMQRVIHLVCCFRQIFGTQNLTLPGIASGSLHNSSRLGFKTVQHPHREPNANFT